MSSKFKWLHAGGHYSPTNCLPTQNVAILIPFRNREAHLRVLLNNLHPILHRQQIMYTVYVIEQADHKPFNKGKLYNIGYLEGLKRDHTCFVFHDVDLIPEDDRIRYGCPRSPMHLSPAIDKFNYRLPDDNLIGGVSAWKKREFEMVNGWSNAFVNWGGEDDDMSSRIIANGLSIYRYRESLGRYTMLKHRRTPINTARFHLLKDSQARFPIDGLSSLVYISPKVEVYQLFTKISVII
ncbi:beta-1,4-N-acetylgalactosaminyltransferase bre-4-like [Ostrea edulis]|uniref:beta-1,4-N-acetylgalactosaminyltransferase bre-4-like n=1 Tax=Ostrea edulis TaxID=37623 RepID=UPI0024AEAC09|nr:beta-1,4-N-acetylgalactosaminyltransferase bre-4-like [Ostrea edulis]